MKFFNLTLNYYAFSALLNAFSSIVIFLLAFNKRPRTFLNKLFCAFTFSVFLWALCYFFWQISNTYCAALFWCKGLMFGAILIMPTNFHFFYVLSQTKNFKFMVMVSYLVAFFLAILNLGSSIVEDVKPRLIFEYWPSAGKLYILFLVMFYGFVIFGSYLLLKNYSIMQKKKQNQVKYVLIACIVGYISTATNFPLWYDIPVLPNTNILVSLYAFLFGYAMIRHNLMDINIVFKKGLVYSILVAIITGIYSLLVLGTGYLFQGFAGYQSFWMNAFVIFIIALAFNPLKDWVQHILDRQLFHGTLESLDAERQRLQQELFHKEKLAYVGQLASSVVHEIRNPLTTIETYLEYFPKKYQDKDFKEKFDRLIPKEIGRIKKLVNNLLSLAKQKKLVLVELNIADLIDSTLGLLEEQFEIKNIRIDKKYESTDLDIKGDEESLKQVFLNLFLNAIQAMTESGTLSVRVTGHGARGTSQTVERKPCTVITITDTGCGMTEYQLAHLFEPFRTSKEEGIGLGLSITKEIIESHGGAISAESEVDKGTTFIIELPLNRD